MKRIFFLFACLINMVFAIAQSLPQKLAEAVKQFEGDPQMKYAIFSLQVVDAGTGKPVYEHNSNVGLAAASTQKLFTSGAAFELLGKDFRYKTELGYDGKIVGGVLKGNLHLIGSGDPTLGSWRWTSTRDSVVLKKFVRAMKQVGITQYIEGAIGTNESRFSRQNIPDGWIWQDIGNYYGAGAYVINWKENQYDLHLRSGSNVGDKVTILEAEGNPAVKPFVNELSSAAKGSGDNAYIYFSPDGQGRILVKGTIPVDERSFSISGASADPNGDLIVNLLIAFKADSINPVSPYSVTKDLPGDEKEDLKKIRIINTHLSPTLDSINYWFLRRSINLYGEALVKTLAYEKEGVGSTEKGVEQVRNFWQQQGIDKAAIHIIDGSGLSPQNRVTTGALVQVLQYAKTRPWYASFYNCLPEYNGMKMKSGSIGGARAFAGYHRAKDGKEYSYAIIVNNYDGSSGDAVKKMYRVLDLLK